MILFNTWKTRGRSAIYAANDDGSDLHSISSHYRLKYFQRLQISPSHRMLLFNANPFDEEHSLFFFWDPGNDRLMVYRQAANYPYHVRWLTDTDLLCFREERIWIAHLADDMLIDLDFGEDLRVTDVAPDRRHLLLHKGEGIGSDIIIGDIETQQVQTIFAITDKVGDPEILCPSSWSPDGRQIICLGGYEDQYWIIDADGSNPRKIANSDYFYHVCLWSPDGARIAFTRTLDNKGPMTERYGVFLKDLAGGEETQILELTPGETWMWTPDGQAIVYAHFGSEYVSLFCKDIHTEKVIELIPPGAEIKDIGELLLI